MFRTFFVAVVLGVLSFKAAWSEDFKVGLIVPNSGVYTALGEEIGAGFDLALEHYGDLAQGHTVTLIHEDTEVKPSVGLAKTKKLVLQDKVDVMVGIVSSGVLGAVRDFVHSAGTPLVVANAGNDDMTGQRCSPNIIRVSFSNSQINRPMGAWLYKQGLRRVYTLAPDYAAGHQMIEAFSGEFVKSGGEVLGGDFTPFRKTKDFGPYLAKAKASGADALYAFYSGSEAVAFVNQYGAFNLKDEMPLYGAGWLTSLAYINAQGQAADGIITALNYTPGIDSEENHRFQSDFQDKFSRIASEFAVQGYDAGRLVLEAIQRSGGNKQAFKDALSKIAFIGPRGKMEIDPKTNNIVQPIYIYKTNVAKDGSVTQSVLEKIDQERDPVNGCVLK